MGLVFGAACSADMDFLFGGAAGSAAGDVDGDAAGVASGAASDAAVLPELLLVLSCSCWCFGWCSRGVGADADDVRKLPQAWCLADRQTWLAGEGCYLAGCLVPG